MSKQPKTRKALLSQIRKGLDRAGIYYDVQRVAQLRDYNVSALWQAVYCFPSNIDNTLTLLHVWSSPAMGKVVHNA